MSIAVTCAAPSLNAASACSPEPTRWRTSDRQRQFWWLDRAQPANYRPTVPDRRFVQANDSRAERLRAGAGRMATRFNRGAHQLHENAKDSRNHNGLLAQPVA